MRARALRAGRFGLLMAALFGVGCPGGGSPDGGASNPSGPGSPAQVREEKVLWTKTASLGPEGGTIELDGGGKLVFPSGALRGTGEISVKGLDPAVSFPDRRDIGAVLDCRAHEDEFATPVELRLPLPPDARPEHADLFLAGTLGAGGVVTLERPVRIEQVDGRSELVVETRHFSVIVVGAASWLAAKVIGVAVMSIANWWDPPPGAVPLIPVPVYKQGAGPECLATSCQMLTKSYAPDCGTIWQLMTEAGITTAGLNSLEISWLYGLSSAIEKRTGVDPSIYRWQPLTDFKSTGSLSGLKRYIKWKLAQGCPVVLNSSAMKDAKRSNNGHSVILLGYRADGTFLGVNPQGPFGATPLTFVEFTEKDLGIAESWTDSYTTVVIDRPPSPLRRQVTLNLPPSCAWFQGLGELTGPVYFLTWDGAGPGGVSWRKKSAYHAKGDGDPCTTVGSDATWLMLGLKGAAKLPRGGLEIINADPVNAHQVAVLLEVFEGGRQVSVAPGGDRVYQEGEVPANSRLQMVFGIEMSKIRPLDTKDPRTFEVRATLYVDSIGGDVVSFPFTIEPDRPKPLVGTWEGTAAMTTEKLSLVIESQSGDDFSGRFIFQGDTLGIEGTWQADSKTWSLLIWETGQDPPLKMGAPGVLMPMSGGRLQLTAPGCVLYKQGVKYDGAGDDPYRATEGFLEKLRK